MNNIFNSEFSGLASELSDRGFIKLDLLGADGVEALLDLYRRSPSPANEHFGFHVSLDLDRAEDIKTISNSIMDVIRGPVERYLADIRYISPRFAVKEANLNSNVPPHQDWSFVDETRFQSYNLWIALTECDESAGTLGFLPNSHNVLTNYRATPLPIFEVPFHRYAEELLGELEFVHLRPGQALMFNSRIIHASKPNRTQAPRINIAVEITDREAELLHYYLSPRNKRIIEYRIEESFFNQYSNAKLTQLYRQDRLPEGLEEAGSFRNRTGRIPKRKLLKQCQKALS